MKHPSSRTRRIEAGNIDITVNSHSLSSRMQQSAIPDVIKRKYDWKTGKSTETKHKASVIEATERSQMSLHHLAITSVRGDKTMDSFGGCCPSPYYGRRERKRPANDED